MHSTTGPSSPLSFKQGIAFFTAAVGFQLVFMVVIAVASHFGVFGGTSDEVLDALFSPIGTTLQVVTTNSALVLFTLIPLRMNRLTFGKTLGFVTPRSLFVLLAIVGVIPLGIIVDEITFLLHSFAPSVFSAQGLDQMVAIFTDASFPGFMLAAVAVAFGPAIGEEVMFRGLLLRSFRNDMSPFAAVIGSSILFGVMHFNMLQGTGALLIGLYLGFVVLKGGSIWPAVAAHAVNNLGCAVMARYAPEGAGKAFSQGHPFWLVAGATVVFCLIAVALLKTRPSSRP